MTLVIQLTKLLVSDIQNAFKLFMTDRPAYGFPQIS